MYVICNTKHQKPKILMFSKVVIIYIVFELEEKEKHCCDVATLNIYNLVYHNILACFPVNGEGWEKQENIFYCCEYLTLLDARNIHVVNFNVIY